MATHRGFNPEVVFGAERVVQLQKFLDSLKTQGYKLIIVSKGYEPIITQLLKEGKLLHFFTRIYGNYRLKKDRTINPRQQKSVLIENLEMEYFSGLKLLIDDNDNNISEVQKKFGEDFAFKVVGKKGLSPENLTQLSKILEK